MFSYFFPTVIVIIDDNQSVLDMFTEMLGSVPYVTVKTFLNPCEALKYINDSYVEDDIDCFHLIHDEDNITAYRKYAPLNMDCLYKEMSNINRFSKISIVISDYLMPDMNGIELCSNIKNTMIRKMLLTGVAGESVAINAFNSGTINSYLRKGHDIEEELIEQIKRFTNEYFELYTNYFCEYFSNFGKTFLNDPVFDKFFRDTLNGGNYIEYYMLDSFGSYLLLDSEGKGNVLSVLNECELNQIIRLGVELGKLSSDVKKKLTSGNYTLAFHSQLGAFPQIKKWKHYLAPAIKLEGHQTYCIALTGTEYIDLDPKSIKPFNQFKRLRCV